MKEHPIIFNAESIRSILCGRKTMTRRVIKPQPNYLQQLRDGRFETSPDGGFDWGIEYIRCPHGHPGDRLWLREIWAIHRRYNHLSPTQAWSLPLDQRPGAVWLKAEGCPGPRGRWRSPIHMPHLAFRITLEIIDVRAERLQEITSKDAEAEGVNIGSIHRNKESGLIPVYETSFRVGFEILWDSINAKRGYGWSNNPWVWVIKFKRVKGVINDIR